MRQLRANDIFADWIQGHVGCWIDADHNVTSAAIVCRSAGSAEETDADNG